MPDVKTLRQEDIVFEPSSVVDQAGRVFAYDGLLYRGLHADGVAIARDLLSLPGCEALFGLGLVRTTISDFRLEGFDLVLAHERVPFVSYCAEWAGAMLKDAALMFCDLSIELAQLGYGIKDGHPWNILFHRCRPVFVDFGSLSRLDADHAFPTKEFRRHFLVPLWLFDRGWGDVAYQAMREHPTGSAKMIAERRFVNRVPLWYRRIARRYMKRHRDAPRKALLEFLRPLRDRIAGLATPATHGRWSGYAQDPGDLRDPASFKTKAASVHRVLQTGDPGTLLDMACNRGWFSYLAASLGHRVVAFDYEPSTVTEVYERSKAGGDDVLPLRMDFLWPTPPFGLGLGGGSSFERFRCDRTLALALVHHLVFGQGVRFDIIAGIIDAYTRNQAIVEFIPADDVYVKEWMTESHGWYTQDGFIEAMRRHFPSVEVLPSNPEPRTILVFSR